MLIGIAGYARSGKDTVGSILVKEHQFHTKAFADLMRASALALNPIVDWSHDRRDVRPIRYRDVVQMVGYERAKQQPEIREFLQRVGTEMGRKVFDPDFWVDRTFARMDLGIDWAITDVRFINEAKAIVARGGCVTRINRTGCHAANDHISEHELDGWVYDHVIQNDGTIDELTHQVQELVAWET
jgi:hypothetical protein